jgi:hypothetical protein
MCRRFSVASRSIVSLQTGSSLIKTPIFFAFGSSSEASGPLEARDSAFASAEACRASCRAVGCRGPLTFAIFAGG